jgi:cytochrome P450
MRDVSNLTYAWMAIQEALRLYPPAWLVSRTAMFADVLGGYAVPAGSLVVISPYLVHRHPAYWPSPLAFDPARFSSEQSEGRDPYCYFPFGGGPRLCIGRRFAMLESRVVLAMIARRLTLTRAPGHVVEPEALVTLRLKHGLRMRAARIAA